VQDSEQSAHAVDSDASWATTEQQGDEEALVASEDEPPREWDSMPSPSDEIDAPDATSQNETASAETFEEHPEPGDGSPPSTERHLAEMRGILQLNEDRLGRLEITLQDLSKQTNFLPPKLRGLGKKVDELSTSVGDARMRSLLSDIAGLGDLTEGALRVFPADDSADKNEKASRTEAHRYFHAIATRVEQILDSYDIQMIPTDTGFDPTLHNAVDVQVVQEKELDGHIMDVIRRGYRSKHSVLRFSEVIVGRLDSQQHTREEDEQTDDISSTYAPFLGASGTAEDNEDLTKRMSQHSSDQPETNNDEADSDGGVTPPSA